MIWVILIGLGLLFLSDDGANTVNANESVKTVVVDDSEFSRTGYEIDRYFGNYVTNKKRYEKYPEKFKHYYVEDLFNFYADNLWNDAAILKMNKKLKDTDVKLTGRIHSINYNYVDGCYITFYHERKDSIIDGWQILFCYFVDQKEIEKVLKLKKGDKITLIGHTERVLLRVLDCYLVDE